MNQHQMRYVILLLRKQTHVLDVIEFQTPSNSATCRADESSSKSTKIHNLMNFICDPNQTIDGLYSHEDVSNLSRSSATIPRSRLFASLLSVIPISFLQNTLHQSNLQK